MNMNPDKSLLNTLFKFKPSSKLYQFVLSRGHVNKTLFTLGEILTILKNEISQQKLFDERNPSIILCSGELEEALNMRALHVTEIRDLVLKHLVRIDNEAFVARYYQDQGQPDPNNGLFNPRPVSAEAGRLIHTANITTNVVVDQDAEFTCRPKFLSVLQTLPEVEKDKEIFSFEEITRFFSTYILRNKQRFIDARNIKVAIVKYDLLGEAFGVSAFHRSQVNNLIRGQIIPVTPGSTTEKAVTTSSGTPGCLVTIRKMPMAQANVSLKQN